MDYDFSHVYLFDDSSMIALTLWQSNPDKSVIEFRTTYNMNLISKVEFMTYGRRVIGNVDRMVIMWDYYKNKMILSDLYLDNNISFDNMHSK